MRCSCVLRCPELGCSLIGLIEGSISDQFDSMQVLVLPLMDEFHCKLIPYFGSSRLHVRRLYVPKVGT